jgi:hypothetical protein
MLSPTWRAALALLLFSVWMGLLFGGFLLGGALHLLLPAAAALFPWRHLPPPIPQEPHQEPQDDRRGAP